MRKYLTKIENSWFERIPSKFTKEERLILSSGTPEQRSSILRAFEVRSLKAPSKIDLERAERHLKTILPDIDYNVINIIFPSLHGCAFSKKGIFRF